MKCISMICMVLSALFLFGCSTKDDTVALQSEEAEKEIRESEQETEDIIPNEEANPEDTEENNETHEDPSLIVTTLTGLDMMKSQVFERNFIDVDGYSIPKKANIENQDIVFCSSDDFDNDGEDEILYSVLENNNICQYLTLIMLERSAGKWEKSAEFPTIIESEDSGSRPIDYSVDVSSPYTDDYMYCSVSDDKKIMIESYGTSPYNGDGLTWYLRSIEYDGEIFRDVLEENTNWGHNYGIGVSGSDGIEGFLYLSTEIAELDVGSDNVYVVEDFINAFETTGLVAPKRLGAIPLAVFNNDKLLCSFENIFDGEMVYEGDDYGCVKTEYTNYTIGDGISERKLLNMLNEYKAQPEEDNSEWAHAYIDYLEEHKEEIDYTGSFGKERDLYYLYVNDDDIPEICIVGLGEVEGNRILTYSHEAGVDVLQTARLGFDYIEKGNVLNNSDGNMGYYYDDVYSITNGKWKKIASGLNYVPDNTVDFSWDDLIYEWNGVVVSEEEYQKSLKRVFDESKAGASKYESTLRNYGQMIETLKMDALY